MYLKSVIFKKPYRCFSNNDSFELKSLTLLVGDQGCGKSTLLQLLQQNDKEYIDIIISKHTKEKGVSSYFFDFEKNNPRTVNPIAEYSDIHGVSKGIGVGGAIQAKWMSHGEALLLFGANCIDKAENCVILLDEPESALSIRNQYKLVTSIENALERNCQLIISTHCLPLIQSQAEVLSLEHEKWMKSEDFIQSQKGE